MDRPRPDRLSEDELVAWGVTTRDPRTPDGHTVELFSPETGACRLGCGGFHERTEAVPADKIGHRPSCPWVRLMDQVVRHRRRDKQARDVSAADTEEIRRLRSDSWLVSGVAEIARSRKRDSAAMLAVLRKHRDGTS